MPALCFSCQKELSVKANQLIGRRDECPFCRADMHACKNCLHYDSKAYNECKEPIADVVKEKDRANFCDHFTFAMDRNAVVDKAALLRAAAEALFKKK